MGKASRSKRERRTTAVEDSPYIRWKRGLCLHCGRDKKSSPLWCSGCVILAKHSYHKAYSWCKWPTVSEYEQFLEHWESYDT